MMLDILNITNQRPQVTIVTGGYSGVGFELTKLLYQNNCTVYIAGRRPEEASNAIRAIVEGDKKSRGKLEFLLLDLADLSTIKKSAAEFLSKETRLDILWNNAGILGAPKGSVSKQVWCIAAAFQSFAKR